MKYLALSIAFLFATPLWGGTYYEATTTTVSDQGTMRSEVKAWVDGDLSKVFFEEVDNPMLSKNSYLLTEDGGRTVFLVNPEDETYMEWDLENLLGGVGNMMQSLGPMMKMEFSNHESEKISEEPGGTLLGLSTTHYVFRSAYDMKIKVMGMGQRSHNEIRQEMWVTQGLEDQAFGVWLRTDPPKTGVEGLDELIADQAQQMEGFPLKSVTTTESTDKKKGRSTTSTTTTEVTELRDETIDPAIFKLPDYTRTEMPSLEGLGGMFGGQ